jgi:hypothetical protein
MNEKTNIEQKRSDYTSFFLGITTISSILICGFVTDLDLPVKVGLLFLAATSSIKH